MYQWIPFRLQRKSPKFPVVTENDLRYMLQCIKRTTNWTNSRAQISSDGHDRMGRKIQLPPPPRKKSLGFPTKSEKIPGPKNDIARCTLFADPYARDTQALPRNLRLFWIPEKSLLKSSVPPPPPPTKKSAQLAYPKKSQDQKFQTNPDSSFIPVSWSPEYPLPLGQKYTHLNTILSVTQRALFSHIFCPLHIAVVCRAVLWIARNKEAIEPSK